MEKGKRNNNCFNTDKIKKFDYSFRNSSESSFENNTVNYCNAKNSPSYAKTNNFKEEVINNFQGFTPIKIKQTEGTIITKETKDKKESKKIKKNVNNELKIIQYKNSVIKSNKDENQENKEEEEKEVKDENKNSKKESSKKKSNNKSCCIIF